MRLITCTINVSQGLWVKPNAKTPGGTMANFQASQYASDTAIGSNWEAGWL